MENTSVDCEKDNARKKEVEKVVKPLIGKIDDKTTIIDIPGVKEIVKDTYICWVYIQRQKVSVKTIHNKLVNKFCIN